MCDHSTHTKLKVREEPAAKRPPLGEMHNIADDTPKQRAKEK